METVFVGREAEQNKLFEMLAAAFGKQLQIAFISGDQGDGKTTLIEHFVEKAQKKFPKLEVAIGTCQQNLRENSYEPFQNIFGKLTGLRAQELHATVSNEREFDLKQRIKIATETLVKIAPDLIGILSPPLALVTKATGIVTDQMVQRRIETGRDKNIRAEQVKEQCSKFLAKYTEKNPIVMVFDDVQWIDPLSLELVEYIQRQLGGLSIFIIATYRPKEITTEIKDWINRTQQDFGDVMLDLRVTQQRHGYEFTRDFLSENKCDVGDEFSTEFYKRSEAKPLFAVELLRYLQSSHVLVQNPLGVWKENPASAHWTSIPARITVLDTLIDERLKVVDEDLREMLRIASIEGYEFVAQVIVRLTGKPERAILEVLTDQLDTQYGFVKEIGEESIGAIIISHFRFSNILYQEHVYSGMGSSVRRKRHGEVAQALEEIYSEHREQIAVQLAQHYQNALNHTKTAEYLVLIAKKQIRNRQSDEALATLDRALALARSSHYIPGIIDSLRLIGMELIQARLYDKAEPYLKECIDLAQDKGNLSALSISLRGMGRIRSSQKKNSEAMRFYMEALSIAKQNKDLGNQGAALTNIGVLASAEERYDDAEYYYDQRLTIAEQMDDNDGRIVAFMNLSDVKRKKGEFQRAREFADKGLQITAELDDWYRDCGIKITLAYIATADGRQCEAAKTLIGASEIAVHKNDTGRLIQSLVCAADLLSNTGHSQVAAQIIQCMLNSNRVSGSEKSECNRIYMALQRGIVNASDGQLIEESHSCSEQELYRNIYPLLQQITDDC